MAKPKHPSLLDTFAGLDQTVKDALAEANSPLLLSLAALNIAATEAGIERLSSEHIVACLEAAGVAVSKTSVSNALARAAGRVSVTKSPVSENLYKLMTVGKKEVETRLGGELMSVVRIEGGQPRTARQRLGDMLAGLKGPVRICDPYYGIRTLDSLDHLPKDTSVQFLTAKTSEAAQKVQGALRDFVKKRPATEFRLAAPPVDLHDRYVLTNDSLLLLGHGFKDIGGKESFIIRLDKSLAPDLLEELTKAFDARWQAAAAL
jgi:hypothetical protein